MTDISTLEKRLADVETRRDAVQDYATKAAADLVKAQDARADHVAAIALGNAAPDAASSPVVHAERNATLAQEAVHLIEAEHAAATEELRRAKRDAEIAARQADLEAAAKIASRLDSLLEKVNGEYIALTEAVEAVGKKYDVHALTGGEYRPFGQASAGGLVLSRLHPEIIRVARVGVFDDSSAVSIADRVARS